MKKSIVALMLALLIFVSLAIPPLAVPILIAVETDNIIASGTCKSGLNGHWTIVVHL